MSNTLAIRVGEVLIERAKAEKGEEFDEWARDLLCGNQHYTDKIEGAFSDRDWPKTMGGENGDLVLVDRNAPHNFPGYKSSNASGEYVIAVLLLNHLYETVPAVQGLYAATNNRDIVRHPAEAYALWYPEGTATAEQELAARMKVISGLRGMAWIDFRYDHMLEMGDNGVHKDMVLGAGHTTGMVPKTCEVLRNPANDWTKPLRTLWGSVSVPGSWIGRCVSEIRTEFGTHYAKCYAFRLDDQADVRIELCVNPEASYTDTCLILLDSDGNTLAENDDIEPGRNLDSRITQWLAAGDYRLEIPVSD